MQMSFFEGTEEAPKPQPKKKRGGNVFLLEFADHVCKRCQHRLVKVGYPSGVESYVCPSCKLKTDGEVEEVCCCGEEVQGHGRVWQCIKNPKITPAMPQEVVVCERPIVKKMAREPGRTSNPVLIHGN